MTKRRLFFALWPDEDVRRELMRYATPIVADIRRSQPQAKCYLPEDLHLTLIFIGAAYATYQTCLSRAARQVVETGDIQPFSLEISRWGYFDRARILWVGCETCPASLVRLQEMLVKELAGCGYKPESRPFRPHVTLMRKAGRPHNLQPFMPVLWRINGFYLVESLPVTEGPRYRVIEEFQF
jgi:2'-5' RNA ligase